MRGVLVLIVLGVRFTIFSCNPPKNNESIIGKWHGEYDNYSYELNIDSLMNFQLIQHETNYNINEGKLEVNNDEIELSMSDEFYSLKVYDNFSTLKIVPKEKMKKDILLVCLVDFKKY